MIPFIKLHTRRLHVTSKIFLRKIAPATSCNNLKQENLENISDLTAGCETSFPDYLGIESDENLINVNPQNHLLQQPKTIDNREKFYRASFGIVRFDSDNKIKYHGQYKGKVDFTFPHSSSEVAKLENISESPSSKKQIHQNLSLLKNSQKASFVDTLDFKTNESTVSDENDIDVNYIDKCYFGISGTNNSSQNNPQNLDSRDLNYLERDYFENLDHSRNLQLKENASESVGKADSVLCNKKPVEKLNYLENEYFGNLTNSENVCTEQNFPDSPNSQKSISTLDSINESENPLQCQDLIKSSSQSHFLENNEEINQQIYNKNIEKIQDYNTERHSIIPDSVFIDNNENEFKKSTRKKDLEVQFKKLSPSAPPKDEIKSHKYFEPSVKKIISMSKESHNEVAKPFSVQNNFKFSQHGSEELDQIVTGHDFVTKLREEQKVPTEIQRNSIGKESKEQKFDSKGFRILKNQVPNLAYFTRDEILNLLKQNVVYSDDDLLILNKPYSLVMHESETTKLPCLSTFLNDLAKELDKQSTNPQLFTVHRLDKETTGCLLLARNETMAMHLKGLFAQGKIVKKYWIITSGVPDPPEGIIDIPIAEGSINNRKRMVLSPKIPSDVPYRNHSKHGKSAVSTYKVIGESGNAALVEVFPKTGIKHQIRVHFGFGLGCPVLGDHKYSHLDKLVPQKLPSDMLQRLHVRQSKVRHIPIHIHAKSVGIPYYFDRRDLFVNIPIPDHFKVNLKRLKFNKKSMIH